MKYLESAGKESIATGRARERKDCKELLDVPAFARFVKLRAVRKRLAEEDGVPAFALFTDSQMAELAQADSFSLEGMKKVLLLTKIRLLLGLSHTMAFLPHKQYEHASLKIDEVGRMLEAWGKERIVN